MSCETMVAATTPITSAITEEDVTALVSTYRARTHGERGYYLHTWGSGYPYQTVTDQSGSRAPVLIMSGPIYAHDISLQDQFWTAHSRGDLCIGIMSCGHWPHYLEKDAAHNSRLAEIRKPHMQAIIAAMHGWLSCEREPTMPASILYSESDQTDCAPRVTPWGERHIDVVLYGGAAATPYYEYHKQVGLGVACLREIQAATGCRAVYVGEKAHEGVEHQPTLGWAAWLNYLQDCRVLLVPSESDASPRIITDALSRGCAVLINRGIFGGWKYVAAETGAFFSSAEDVIDAYKDIMVRADTSSLSPSSWYGSNWGSERASLRLRAFCELLGARRDLNR